MNISRRVNENIGCVRFSAFGLRYVSKSRNCLCALSFGDLSGKIIWRQSSCVVILFLETWLQVSKSVKRRFLRYRYRNASDLINSRDWSFIHRQWQVFLKADILGDLFRVRIETQRQWKYKLYRFIMFFVGSNCFLTVFNADYYYWVLIIDEISRIWDEASIKDALKSYNRY